jgi:hypothetical protein
MRAMWTAYWPAAGHSPSAWPSSCLQNCALCPRQGLVYASPGEAPPVTTGCLTTATMGNQGLEEPAKRGVGVAATGPACCCVCDAL